MREQEKRAGTAPPLGAGLGADALGLPAWTVEGGVRFVYDVAPTDP